MHYCACEGACISCCTKPRPSAMCTREAAVWDHVCIARMYAAAHMHPQVSCCIMPKASAVCSGEWHVSTRGHPHMHVCVQWQKAAGVPGHAPAHKSAQAPPPLSATPRRNTRSRPPHLYTVSRHGKRIGSYYPLPCVRHLMYYALPYALPTTPRMYYPLRCVRHLMYYALPYVLPTTPNMYYPLLYVRHLHVAFKQEMRIGSDYSPLCLPPPRSLHAGSGARCP